MEKFTEYFEYCYPMDTTVEYVNTTHYSMLNCTFTSEDEDAGSETIHSDPSLPVKPKEQMAYEMLQEITKFMDMCDEGRVKDIPTDLKWKYEKFMHSTLIAVEKALQDITANYNPAPQTKWFLTIEDAGKLIAERMLTKGSRSFCFCEASEYDKAHYTPEEYGKAGSGWFGVKRINGFFDNSPRELIVAVGYYGGGNCSFAYVCEEDVDTITPAEEITRAILESTGGEPNDIIFVEEDDKDEQET